MCVGLAVCSYTAFLLSSLRESCSTYSLRYACSSSYVPTIWLKLLMKNRRQWYYESFLVLGRVLVYCNNDFFVENKIDYWSKFPLCYLTFPFNYLWNLLTIPEWKSLQSKSYIILSVYVVYCMPNVHYPPLILAPLVNMSKGGCENKSALFMLLIFHSKNSNQSLK